MAPNGDRSALGARDRYHHGDEAQGWDRSRGTHESGWGRFAEEPMGWVRPFGQKGPSEQWKSTVLWQKEAVPLVSTGEPQKPLRVLPKASHEACLDQRFSDWFSVRWAFGNEPVGCADPRGFRWAWLRVGGGVGEWLVLKSTPGRRLS